MHQRTYSDLLISTRHNIKFNFEKYLSKINKRVLECVLQKQTVKSLTWMGFVIHERVNFI